ncbi:MAG: hypothetical protein J5996_04290 [Prevotella sp.]|nr:hypothetical protein [Prevotella sp.]
MTIVTGQAVFSQTGFSFQHLLTLAESPAPEIIRYSGLYMSPCDKRITETLYRYIYRAQS